MLPTLQFSKTSCIYSFTGESIVNLCLKGAASSFMERKKKGSKIKLSKGFFFSCRKRCSLIRLVHRTYFPLRNAAFLHWVAHPVRWLIIKGVILFFICKKSIYIVYKLWFKKLLVPDRPETFEKLADGGVGRCKYHSTFVT